MQCYRTARRSNAVGVFNKGWNKAGCALKSKSTGLCFLSQTAEENLFALIVDNFVDESLKNDSNQGRTWL